jgi:hypothetical protein
VHEFAGDDQPLTTPGDRLSQQGLVVAGAIARGGVEEGDAQSDGAVDGLDRFGLRLL